MKKHEELIADEITRQDRMWGDQSERSDVSNRQLQQAAMAQLVGLDNKQWGIKHAFAENSVARDYYPRDWFGFRDYGSDVANLVVAIAYLTNEVKRLVSSGADTTRTPRDPVTQPYAPGTVSNVAEWGQS